MVDNAIGPYWDCDCFTDGEFEDKRRVIRASAYEALEARLRRIIAATFSQDTAHKIASEAFTLETKPKHICHCGHLLEEHNYYGSRCDVGECECVCFESASAQETKVDAQKIVDGFMEFHGRTTTKTNPDCPAFESGHGLLGSGCICGSSANRGAVK